MEKKKSWFNLLKKVFCSQRKSKQEKEGRRRFLFKWVQSKTSLPTITFSSPTAEKTLIEAEEEQKRHAFTAAIATTAAAEAAMAAAQAAAEVVRLRGTPLSPHLWVGRIREVAVIKIQTAFRGYLARKALRALKGLVKLQAMARGSAVRRQGTTTLKSLQSLIKVKSQVQEKRIMMEKTNWTREAEQGRKQKKDIVDANSRGKKLEKNGTKTWDGSFQSKEEVDAMFLIRREAAFKRERAVEYACSQQQARRDTKKSTTRITEPESEPDTLNSRWSWVEEWVETQPWVREPNKELLVNLHQIRHSHLDSVNVDNAKDPQVRQGSPSPISLPRKSFQLPMRKLSSDYESFCGSPAVPSYMASTKSAQAKARSSSTPKQRVRLLDAASNHSSPSRNKLSPLPSVHSDVGHTKIGKPHGSYERSPRLKGLAGPVKSDRYWKDLSIDSDCSLLNWDRQKALR